MLACIIFSSSAFSDTIITNTATANYSVNGSSQQLSASVQFTKDTIVIPTDEITLSKQVSVPKATVGEFVTYSLEVNNPNNSELTNLVINDSLPIGLYYINGTAKLNNIQVTLSDVTVTTGNLLKISVGNIPANTTWSITYLVKALGEGIKLNKATAHTTTAISNIAQVSIEITKPIIPPTVPLTLTKQADKQKATLDDIINYQLIINNPNNKAIDSVVIQDSLPPGLTYILNSSKFNNTPITKNPGNGLSFSLGTIPANASWVLSYQTKVESGSGILTNSAYASSNDSAATSNTASASVEISNDKILLNKVANKINAAAGDSVLYSITVKNPQDHTLTNMVISDTLPSGFVYQDGSAKLNAIQLKDSAVQVTNNHLAITIPSLPKNDSVTITYQLTVTDAAPLGNAINSVSAKSDLAHSTTTTATVVVKSPTLPILLEKSANVSKVKLGDIVEYHLTIENPNTTTVEGLSIKDLLPDGLEYIIGSALLDKNTIIANTENGLNFLLKTIPGKTTWDLSYKAKVIKSKGLDSFTNKATITTKESIADSSEATSTIEVSNDEIKLTKIANKEKVMIGELIKYTIQINNAQNHALNNVKVTDTLPLSFAYQKGSATLDGKKIISNNILVKNNILSFNIPTIQPKKTLTLSYEVLVLDTSKIGDAKNSVQAESDFAISNIASAFVNVRTPSTIRFLEVNESGLDSIVSPTAYNDNQSGGKHWQEIDMITLSNGTSIKLPNTLPLKDAGQYTALDPIVIEVVDLDQNIDPTVKETIIVVINTSLTNDKEVLLLQETTPDSGVFVGVIITASGETTLQNGVLSLEEGSKINVLYHDESDASDKSANAALVIPNTEITISKVADKEKASLGEQVRYSISFNNNSKFSIPTVRLIDILPPGFRFIPDSARLNGSLINTKVKINGKKLDFSLGRMPIGASWTLDYLTKVSAGVQIGKAINTAYIDSGKFQSNKARATVNIIDDLMRTKNILVGRVYVGCETQKNPKVLKDIRIYNEMGRSILTDKNGFWHMEGVEPGTHVLQLDTDSLPAGYEPTFCQENTRFAGDSASQFVDLLAGTLWQVNFHVKKSKSTTGSKDDLAKHKKIEKLNPVKLFDKEYLKTAQEGFEILWPKNNYVPDVSSTKIFIKSSPKHKIDVFLNGKKVSPLNYDGSDSNKARTVTIRRWYGVDISIKNRDNTLLVIAKDKTGKEVARKTHNIHFSGKPASAQFLPDQSVLIADGKTTPIIALLIRDEDGYPMRANTHGYFTIENNRFTVKTLRDDKKQINLNGAANNGTYQYYIEDNGIARIELNPTTQSGQIKINVKFSDASEKSIHAWLKPKLRDWILVGLAEGTIAHQTISDNLKALDDNADSFYKRGRLAFFAKGKVKGKYLLTVAYDTHKGEQEVGSQLDGKIDPDAWYTIYADNSNSQYNAPSSSKLYLKIEKDNFYALFGDYRTDMNVTELASYERTLQGIKSEYQGEKLSYNAFISQTSNSHHHEEIAGDGTSGLYHLSHNILSNSETIVIETRDRFHSERILSTKTLSRYQDYQIDYDAGTLFFKYPISSRDSNFNPNIIVIDYDSETDNNKEIIAGGRVALKTDNEKLEVGISALHIGKNQTKSDSLIAVDTSYKITDDMTLHAEIAQSKTEKSGHESMNGQILELEKEIAGLEAKLYFRKHEKNFGIDSQNSENGTQKVGAEVRYKLNKKTLLNAEISQQKNLSNNNKRLLAEANVDYKLKQVNLTVGLRHSKEDLEEETKVTNNVVLLGAKYTTENGKVSFRSNLEKNINSRNETEISPDRVLVGVDVKLQKGLTLFAEQEITKSSSTTTQNTRVGLSKDLWKGAKAKTSFTKERTDEKQRNYATLGLTQRIDITDKLKADISIDHAKTINDNQKRFNQNEPSQQGTQNSDFTAFSIGLGANEKDWGWTSRIELKKGDIEDKINFTAGIIRELKDGKQFSGKFSYYNSEKSNGDTNQSAKLSFGSAWHPQDKDFVFFSRLDLIDEKSNISTLESGNVDTHTQKIIHNMHYNRKINKKTQVSIHHGIKHVIDRNKQTKHKATFDTTTVEVRRDINKKWDIGAKGGYLHDWTENTTETVAGVSLGVTPAKNAWLEFGYNFKGFNDKDFDDNGYTQKGPFISFRYKFNQSVLPKRPSEVEDHK